MPKCRPRPPAAGLAVDLYGDAMPPALRIKTDANATEHYAAAFAAMNAVLRDRRLMHEVLRAFLDAGNAHAATDGRAAADVSPPDGEISCRAGPSRDATGTNPTARQTADRVPAGPDGGRTAPQEAFPGPF